MSYYKSKVKLDDWLYRLDYDDIDYQFAEDYYKNNGGDSFGGCTSFRLGDYFGRNYDWLYDYSETFLVTTPRRCNRHKVIGIVGNIEEFTKQFVESGEESELYRLVPCALLDGMNDCGLVVSMNVVPLDYGVNVSVPRIELRHELCSKMIPRFLLDRFSDATSAVNYLRDYCSIYCSKKLIDKGYEIHFIVSDSFGQTYVVELIDNRLNIINHNVITNFHISNVRFNSDGKVFTPSTQMNGVDAVSYNNVTENGCGLERYNLVKSLRRFCKNDIRKLLKNLYYSNAYRNLNWFTEFVGNGLFVNSSVKDYVKKLAPIIDDLEYKSRDDSVLWQTVHSTLYDIPNRSLEVVVQESSRPFVIRM